MQKRWTIHPHNPKPPRPWLLEDALARYPSPQTPAQRGRLVKLANREFGKALLLRGAVKRSRLRKLVTLSKKIDDYNVPEAALTAQGQMKEKEAHD